MKKEMSQGENQKTFKQVLRETIFKMSKNEKVMQEMKEKNPQLYDLTLKVAREEEEKKNVR